MTNARSSFGVLAAATLFLTSFGAAPVAQAPQNADLAVAQVEQASQLGQVTSDFVPDSASDIEPVETRAELTEAVAPADYTQVGEQEAAEAIAAQSEVIPLNETSEDAQSVGETVEETVPTEELSIIRQPISSDSVIFGVTLPGYSYADGVSFEYRTLSGEVWSQWQVLDLAEPAEDVEGSEKATIGTDPIPLTGVSALEVVARDSGGTSVPGAVLSVIDPGGEQQPDALDVDAAEMGALAGETEETKTDDSGEAEASDETAALDDGASIEPVAYAVPTSFNTSKTVFDAGNGLKITTRKGWGANESWMDWTPKTVTFKGAVVHHTAGTNNYTPEQVPGLVRGIYYYHAVSLGWGDVGYHLLVDKYGGVWEGRSGGLTSSVQGGHAYGANSQTFGISVLGDYSNVAPPAVAIDAVAKAIAWKLSVHGIKSIDGTINVPGQVWGKTNVNIPIVSGHRDVGGTACPGAAFYVRLGELRNSVKRYLSGYISGGRADQKPPVSATKVQWEKPSQIGRGWTENLHAAPDFRGQGSTDALLIRSDGSLWLYPSMDTRTFGKAVQIGRGWNAVDQITAGVDFDADGFSDIVARNKTTGDLMLYSGNGEGGFKAVAKIGHGWKIFTKVVVLPEMNSDQPVVYGIAANGALSMYLTNGLGKFTGKIDGGSGWGAMRALIPVGDKTQDGLQDFAAIDTQGRMWLYPGNGAGGFTARTQIGNGWGGMKVVRSAQHEGVLWAVDSRGILWRYVLNSVV